MFVRIKRARVIGRVSKFRAAPIEITIIKIENRKFLNKINFLNETFALRRRHVPGADDGQRRQFGSVQQHADEHRGYGAEQQ